MTVGYADEFARIYVGDVLDGLRELADETVQVVVTSPPYWGLRDYGTGSWAGGDPACDHLGPPVRNQAGFNARYYGKEFVGDKQGEEREPMGSVCRKCGAERTDAQLGLEATPEEFVANMVVVFREVRRVLRGDGTLLLNLGDSYASGDRDWYDGGDRVNGRGRGHNSRPATPPSLKPKDLVGIPWRLAFALQADGWWLRSDVIWSKPNPMPESVAERPTKAHEYLFLLAKSERYYYDGEAIREPVSSPIRPGRVPQGWDVKTPAGWDMGNGRHDEIPLGSYKNAAGAPHSRGRRLVENVKAARSAGGDHDSPFGELRK